MTTKLEQAARQALGALVRAEAMYGQPNADIQTALREALDHFADAGNKVPDHIAASGKPIAEPVKQEPVAHYKDAPHTIYLQTGCDDPDPVNCECAFNEWGDTSWCADQIHDTDIPYIRADYAAQVDAKAIRAEALDEAAMLAYDLRFRSCWTAEAIAAAIRKLK